MEAESAGIVEKEALNIIDIISLYVGQNGCSMHLFL